MADVSESVVAIVARVGTPGQPAFQLRKGEMGLSVFDPNACDPPLTESEILEPFRPGSMVLYRIIEQIRDAGLEVALTPGADCLPDRLRITHREIIAGPAMTRSAFKAALKLLE
jgi:hypothetical protein